MVAILILDTKFSSTAATPVYEPIGCFSNRGISPHPMSLLLKDFRPDMNWNEIDSVVKRCANLAHEKRLRYFGLKYYGECWSGETADQTYNRDGPSEACVRGVGQRSSYFVYKFYDYGDKSPGCKDTWKGQDNVCFQLQASRTLTRTAETVSYCNETLAPTVTERGVRLVEQFLYILNLNSQSNFSRCLVIGKVNTSSCSTLPSFTGLSIGNATLTCAVRERSKWNVQSCNGSECGYLSIAPRDINPVSGSFVQHATDASIIGHVIKRLLVDDAVSCARECLLYLNCQSINYEYKPTANPESIHLGMICELNDNTSTDVHFQPRFGYKYYERLTPNSLTQFHNLFQ